METILLLTTHQLLIHFSAAAAASIKVYHITRCCGIGDRVYDGTYITIWSSAECNLGIIAASIPCLRPLFGRYFGQEYRNRSNRSDSIQHTQHHLYRFRNHCRHICRPHEKTIVTHNYTSEQGEITPQRELPIFGQASSDCRPADGDSNTFVSFSSVDGRHWERRESPYYQQDLDSVLNDVELGDSRVMYANMARAMLGPLRIIDSEGSEVPVKVEGDVASMKTLRIRDGR